MTESKIPGLTTAEAKRLQQRYGRNELTPEKKQSFFKKTLSILGEPMFLLLIIAAVIYFFLGEPRDGAIMLVFVLGVISIDIVQEWKTDKTLKALRDLSTPRITVLRDGGEVKIESADLVPGDVMLITEGIKIPADGMVLKCSDLRVDESTLTGEAEGVWKAPADTAGPQDGPWRSDTCYAGTLVIQGSGHVLISKIGAQTAYGKIGVDVAGAPETKTPLQTQIGNLVKLSAGIAAVLFALVGAVTYLNIPDHPFGARIVESILSGITLAMAMIPEEFPVILTVFLSMGAWRLAKRQSLVGRLASVETLGAVSVLCVDKTGTITVNKMTVSETWADDGDTVRLAERMGLGCETDTYDPMEKAMLTYCENLGITKEHLFGGELLFEYSFTDEQKMMGHVWRHDNEIIIAAKGSPERILTICDLTDEKRRQAEQKIHEMSGKGLRVIAVGEMRVSDALDIPSDLSGCTLTLCGLVGLADPPRETVKADIARCVKAGVRVVMITGDNGVTAGSIANQIGMPGADKVLTGEELSRMSDDALREAVREVGIFARVIPEHKMRIVKALQANGHIVAMTGDGVNDAPALKHADIGIAMGKKGSEVSREAADLILMDDNFSTIVDTIRDGRRIYANIRRAVGYVFSIHIPIALASLLAPFLKISSANLMLLPLHVVLLELIIDPTCSIVFERLPAERGIMDRPPRDPKENIVTPPLLFKSVLQGLVIFAASFGTYYMMQPNLAGNAPAARAMGLAVLMLANLFLVLVNSSDHDFVFHSFKQVAQDKVLGLIAAGTVAGLLLILYTPLAGILKLAPLSASQLLMAACTAAVSVLWYEAVKLYQKKSRKKVKLV